MAQQRIRNGTGRPPQYTDRARRQRNPSHQSAAAALNGLVDRARAAVHRLDGPKGFVLSELTALYGAGHDDTTRQQAAELVIELAEYGSGLPMPAWVRLAHLLQVHVAALGRINARLDVLAGLWADKLSPFEQACLAQRFSSGQVDGLAEALKLIALLEPRAPKATS